MTTFQPTRELILYRLRRAPGRRMLRCDLHAVVRYRENGLRTIRALVADGTLNVVRGVQGKRGRRPVLYRLPRR